MDTKRSILIICEGDSEFAYIQELNRYLNEQGVSVVLLPCNAGGGGFVSLRQVCRAKKTRRNGRTFIFADRDIYFRDDNGNGSLYESEMESLPPFLFQTWNFEDFLLMHSPASIVAAWRKEAQDNGHVAMPMHSAEYLPVFESFCQRHNDILDYELPYEKGDMPFPLTGERLSWLLENNDSSGGFPHTDMVKVIAECLVGKVKS